MGMKVGTIVGMLSSALFKGIAGKMGAMIVGEIFPQDDIFSIDEIYQAFRNAVREELLQQTIKDLEGNIEATSMWLRNTYRSAQGIEPLETLEEMLKDQKDELDNYVARAMQYIDDIAVNSVFMVGAQVFLALLQELACVRATQLVLGGEVNECLDPKKNPYVQPVASYARDYSEHARNFYNHYLNYYRYEVLLEYVMVLVKDGKDWSRWYLGSAPVRTREQAEALLNLQDSLFVKVKKQLESYRDEAIAKVTSGEWTSRTQIDYKMIKEFITLNTLFGGWDYLNKTIENLERLIYEVIPFPIAPKPEFIPNPDNNNKMPVEGSENWIPNYRVRYRVSFLYDDGIEGKKGPWGDWFFSDIYAMPKLTAVPIDPYGCAKGRKIYREICILQIVYHNPELVKEIGNNTETFCWDEKL